MQILEVGISFPQKAILRFRDKTTFIFTSRKKWKLSEVAYYNQARETVITWQPAQAPSSYIPILMKRSGIPTTHNSGCETGKARDKLM